MSQRVFTVIRCGIGSREVTVDCPDDMSDVQAEQLALDMASNSVFTTLEARYYVDGGCTDPDLISQPVTWHDVRTFRPEWTEEQAQAWLLAHSERLREALWQAALEHLEKCLGNTGRKTCDVCEAAIFQTPEGTWKHAPDGWGDAAAADADHAPVPR